MHDSAKSLIQRYQDIGSQGDPDGSSRHALIQRMGQVLHPDVCTFFSTILADPSEADIARLEVLKVLEFAIVGEQKLYRVIGSQILRIVGSPEEGLLREYAVMAAANFVDIEGLVETLTKTLLNTKEDLDTRWNAFAFIRRVGETRQTREVLLQLEQDPDFGQAANELLEQWDSRSRT
jgi:hypothetical protein